MASAWPRAVEGDGERDGSASVGVDEGVDGTASWRRLGSIKMAGSSNTARWRGWRPQIKLGRPESSVAMTAAAAEMELDLGLGFEEPRSEGRGVREQREARHQGGSLTSAKARGQRRRGRGGMARGAQDNHCSNTERRWRLFT